MAEPRRERIEQLRDDLNLSRTQLATKVGISYSHMWGIERGRHDASTDILCRIALALGSDIDDVMIRPAVKDEPPTPAPDTRRVPPSHPEPARPEPPPRPTRTPKRTAKAVS